MQGLHKLFNTHLTPTLLSQPDLDQILVNGLSPSSWTSPRHFDPTQRYIGSLHAPSICGVRPNGHNHFVVFYICPDFRTITDPLHNVTFPNLKMTNIIGTTLAVTYLHHGLPIPPPHPFKRVYRIAIQNDSLQAPWPCETIAILTTLHLTLGHIRPDKIHTASIHRRQYLTFHQSVSH